MPPADDHRGFFATLIGDGRPLLVLTALILILCGAFAIFQSATGHFLPQDVDFLGMTEHDLCRLNQCRIVHFMFHDRVSFGGALIAIGALYLWLTQFPLAHGEPWAWWVLLLSGAGGFASFLAYLGYGYLDTWHGAATLLLLPCFVGGLWKSCLILRRPIHIRCLLRPAVAVPWRSRYGIARALLLVAALALIAGGLTIMFVGMTTVFVPQDLAFMGLSAADIRAVNPHLVPLIAHDRAGFGGGLFSTGIAVLFCVWCGPPSRSLWQALCVAGVAGYSTAIGIHPIIGYLSWTHLGPAILAAAIFAAGLALSRRAMYCGLLFPSATAASGATPR